MKKLLIILFLFGILLFNFSPVFAQSGTVCTGELCLTNPLGATVNSPQLLIGKIITAIMGIVGSIALLMFVYGGLTWMTSSGNQEKVKKGRDIILWSSVGLVVVFMAYALTKFVITTIAQ